MHEAITELAYIAVVAIGCALAFGACVFIRWQCRMRRGGNMLFRAHDHLANHSRTDVDWGDFRACMLILRKVDEL